MGDKEIDRNQEISPATIMRAKRLAQALRGGNEPRAEVALQFPDGQKIKGLAFRSSDGTTVIVTDTFIATSNRKRITQYIPIK